MTRGEAKELLPVIQAFAEGKKIEYHDDNDDEWIETSTPVWQVGVKYRIKTEPKYRPFKTKEECWNEMLKHQPFGWIKNNGNDLYSIASINCGGITTFAYYRFLKSFEKFTFIDGTPFGIKEE